MLSDSSGGATEADGCSACNQPPLILKVLLYVDVSNFLGVPPLLNSCSTPKTLQKYFALLKKKKVMLLYFLKYARLHLILISARYHHYVTLIMGSLHCLHSSESTHLLSGGGSFKFPLGCCLLALHTLLQRYLLACVRSRRCPSGIRDCSNELVRTRLSPSSISLHHFCVFGPCMLCHT